MSDTHKKNPIWLAIIIIILAVSSVLIGVLSAVLLYRTASINASMDRSLHICEHYREVGDVITEGMDVLTENARQFAATGDIGFAEAYFEELSGNTHWNKAMRMLHEFDDVYNLKSALRESENVRSAMHRAEYHAMRLCADGYGIAPDKLPIMLQNVALSEEELLKNREDKKRTGKLLLFDETYEGYRSDVLAGTDKKLAEAARESMDAYKKNDEKLGVIAEKQRICLVIFGCLMAALFLMMLVQGIMRRKQANTLERVLKKQRETDSMIAGLSDDYAAVFYAEPYKDNVITVRQSDWNIRHFGRFAATMTFEVFVSAIVEYVHPDDRRFCMEALDRENILAKFAGTNGKKHDVVFARENVNGTYHYFRCKQIRVDNLNADGGFGILIGFLDADDLVRDEQNREEKLRREVREQTELIRNAVKRNYDIQHNVVEGMATLVESRDLSTGEHIHRTRKIYSMLVDYLRDNHVFEELADENYVEDIKNASVLHDIGKIFISDAILNKPGALSGTEQEIMQSHTRLGNQIVEDVFHGNIEDSTAEVIREIVMSHHEKWNGEGYPNHLVGDDIPLSARIMAVADVFDALISRRSYKDAYSVEAAYEIVEKESGAQFDARIVEAFCAIRPEVEKYLREDADIDRKI